LGTIRQSLRGEKKGSAQKWARKKGKWSHDPGEEGVEKSRKRFVTDKGKDFLSRYPTGGGCSLGGIGTIAKQQRKER